MPPTIGFYAKLMVVQSVIDAGLLWLAIVSVLMAVIGAYYYLRVVKLMYFDQPDTSEPIVAGADMRAVVSINALALLLVLPWVGLLIDLCRQAIQAVA